MNSVGNGLNMQIPFYSLWLKYVEDGSKNDTVSHSTNPNSI